MGISIRKDALGNPTGFQAQIRTAGESISRTFKTYEEAKEFETATLAAIASSRAKAGAKAPRRQAARPPGPAALAAESVRSILDKFERENPGHSYCECFGAVKRAAGPARVCDLDKKWCKTFVARAREVGKARRGGQVADGTIANYIKVVKHVCRWRAEELGVECPTLGLSTKALGKDWDRGRDRRLRGDEEARIREALGQVGSRPRRGKDAREGERTAPRRSARQWQLFFDFAIATCARRSEMVDLTWPEVDMQGKIWRLPASRSKTGTRRDIYLTPKALEILGELWELRENDTGRVFHKLPTGHHVSKMFRSVCDRLGIRDLVLHDLRHEGITRLLLSDAIKPQALMMMVGHTSPKMMMRYFNPRSEEVLDRMWRVLGEGKDGAGGARGST